MAHSGSTETACVDQTEDMSPQSSPFRDPWIGKDVRNKRVSDRVLFPSPAPSEFKHLRQSYGVGVLLSGVMSPPCSQIRTFPPDSPRGSSAAHRSRIVRVALSKALVSYHTDDRTKHLAGMMDDGLLLVTNTQGLLSPNAIEPFKPPDDIECGRRAQVRVRGPFDTPRPPLRIPSHTQCLARATGERPWIDNPRAVPHPHPPLAVCDTKFPVDRPRSITFNMRKRFLYKKS